MTRSIGGITIALGMLGLWLRFLEGLSRTFGVARGQSNAVLIAGACLVSCCGAANGEGGRRSLAGHVPAIVRTLQPTGRLPVTNQIDLAIWLPLRNRYALTNLLQATYDPSSANYRQFLEPAEFTEKFGPSEEEYDAVVHFARTNRLEIVNRHANRALLHVRGNVSDIERAFQVVFRTYRHPTEQREFYAPDREPSVDARLAILSIDGLNNLATLRAAFHLRQSEGSLATPMGSGPGGSFLGADFRRAYVPGVTLNGSGQILGLLEFSAYQTNDVLDYEAQAGLPNVPIVNDLLPGASSDPSTNEIALNECVVDIEMSVAMATGLVKVVLFVPPSAPGGLGDALAPYYGDLLNTMVSSNQIKQFGSSWGYVGDPTPNPGFDQVFAQMAAQGQSFFEASGDADAWVNPIWVPAASPYVTCVGATTLTMNGNSTSYVSETVWNSGNELNQWGPNLSYSWGSGGGVSPDYAIPYYQQGLVMTANGGSTTLRNIPDVAMVGDNIWLVFQGGYGAAASGTSMSTPLWAAFTALVNQQAAAKGVPSACRRGPCRSRVLPRLAGVACSSFAREPTFRRSLPKRTR